MAKIVKTIEIITQAPGYDPEWAVQESNRLFLMDDGTVRWKSDATITD